MAARKDAVFVWAFVDDVAAIIKDLAVTGRLCDVTQTFGGNSNCKLNFPKTVLVPLFLPRVCGAARARARRFIRDAKGVQISLKAKCLGVWLGPGVDDEARWKAPLEKAR